MDYLSIAIIVIVLAFALYVAKTKIYEGLDFPTIPVGVRVYRLKANLRSLHGNTTLTNDVKCTKKKAIVQELQQLRSQVSQFDQNDIDYVINRFGSC